MDGRRMLDATRDRGLRAARALLRSQPNVVRQAVAPRVRRVGELVAQRTEFSRTYELSDGRRQAVISAGPVDYRDAAGRWEPVSTTVTRSPRAGWPFENTTNVFGSLFSSDPARLVRFELPAGGGLQTGLAGGGGGGAGGGRGAAGCPGGAPRGAGGGGGLGGGCGR